MATGTFPRMTFGLVPVSADATTRTHLADFCSALGDQLGAVILPHRAPSPLALASAFHAGRVHFAWFSPTLLATSPAISSAVPLVSSVREGVASYHAVLFVPAESRIQSVHDLAGTHAAWVAESSAAGYLFPRLALERRGLDPQSLFASERFYQSYDATARAVLDGAADVGAAFAVYEHGDPKLPLLRAGFDKAADGRAVRVIDVSGPIPADVIVASRAVPSELRASAAIALARLSNDPASERFVKPLFGVDGFEHCGQGVLHSLRNLVPLAMAASHR